MERLVEGRVGWAPGYPVGGSEGPPAGCSEQHAPARSAEHECEPAVEQALARRPDAPERIVERALVQAAHAAGGVARKLLTPGVRGAPDRLVLLPGGVVRFVECKGRGGRLSASQCREHARLRALGCEVWVVWTVEEARAVCRIG